MTLYELEWAFTAWCDAGRHTERRLLEAVAQSWFLHSAAHGDRLDSRLAGGGAVLVPIGALGIRRALWADEVVLLGEGRATTLVHAWALGADRPGSSLQVWTARVPCWTPLQAGKARGQVIARSGSA